MIRPFLVLSCLQARGMIRRGGRQLRKPLQAVLTAVGGGIFLLMFLPMLLIGFFQGAAVAPETVRTLAPFFVLLLFASSFAAPKPVLFFSPPQINFLFAGPFTRRALLGYRMVVGIGGACLSALVIALFLRLAAPSYGHAWVAASLSSIFVLLLNLLLTLLVMGVRQWIGERVLRIGFLLLVAVVAWLAFRSVAELNVQAFLAALEEGVAEAVLVLRELTLVTVLVAPFDFLGNLFAADGAFFRHAIFTAGICLFLGAGAIVLPVDFREEAICISRRIEVRKQRVENGHSPLHSFRFSRLRLPLLPCWGGMGPILWRQLLLGVRRLPGILLLSVLVATPGLLVFFNTGAEGAGFSTLLPLLVFVTIFMSSNGATCDFRADLRHMDVLKALPARPFAVAWGELLAPVVLLALAQGVILGLFFFLLPDSRLWLIGAGAGLVAVNVILIAVENLGVLLFPAQQRNATTDPVAMMRMMVFVFIKFAVVGLLLLLVGAGGFLTSWLTGSGAAGVIAAFLLAATCCVLLGWAVAAAFRQFDPASEAPE